MYFCFEWFMFYCIMKRLEKYFDNLVKLEVLVVVFLVIIVFLGLYLIVGKVLQKKYSLRFGNNLRFIWVQFEVDF